MKYFTTIADKTYEIEINGSGAIIVNGKPYEAQSEKIGAKTASLLVGTHSYETAVVENGGGIYEVVIAGDRYEALVQDELTYRVAQAQEAAATAMGEVTVQSPMPGLILNVPVAIGDIVAKGQTLVILESMKMENELKSPRDGVVLRVSVEAGASVEKGANLVTVGDSESE